TITELGKWSITSLQGSKEAEVVAEIIEKAIDTAEAMKIPLVMLPSFGKSSLLEEDLERLSFVLEDACEYALAKNVQIATENAFSPDHIKALFTKVNKRNLYLYLDTQNYYINKGWYT